MVGDRNQSGGNDVSLMRRANKGVSNWLLTLL